MYNGWTVNDLVELDAFNHKHLSSRPTTADFGADALHPLVERPRWRTQNDLGAGEAFLPIGDELGGHYEVDDWPTHGELTSVSGRAN